MPGLPEWPVIDVGKVAVELPILESQNRGSSLARGLKRNDDEKKLLIRLGKPPHLRKRRHELTHDLLTGLVSRTHLDSHR